MGVESELSPLDQIQQAEAEVIRRVAAAREATRLAEVKAREEADAILLEARRSGQREGDAQYERIITDARAEADAILEQAHQRAEGLRHRGKARKLLSINRVTNIVLGIREKAERP